MRFFRALDFGFVLWVSHAVVAGVLLAPVLWIGRRRAQWHGSDMLALVVPFLAWWLLFSSGARVKSLGNAGEAAYLGVAVAATGALRVWLGQRADSRPARISLLVAVTLAAVGVYLWTPVLPEVGGK